MDNDGRILGVPLMIKRFLTSILITLFLFETPMVLAGSQKPMHPSVIVLTSQPGSSSQPYQKEARDITNQLRKKLEKSGSVEVVPQGRTEEIVSQVQDPNVGTQVHDLLMKAKGSYLEFEMGKARSEAQKALNIAENQVQKTGDTTGLQEAHLILGLIDIAENKKNTALTHFKTVFFFQPERAFTDSKYPSRVLEVLQQARKEATKSDLGELEIATESTGAEVYVDGFHRGHSPLRVKALPVGVHYLKAVKTGGKSPISKFEVVSQKDPQKVELKLEATAGEEETLTPPLHPKLEQVASLSQVQKVVLVSLNPEQSSAVSIIVYDRDQGRETPFKAPTANLTAQVLSQIHTEVAEKNTKNEPYIPYKKVHEGKRKDSSKSSFYKKPLFWVAVGVVAAGAGAATGLALSMGGGQGSTGTISGNTGFPVSVSGPDSKGQ